MRKNLNVACQKCKIVLKMWKMTAILDFKMADQDSFEKNGTNLNIVAEGIKIPKIIGSTYVAKIAPILKSHVLHDNHN